MRDRNGLRLGRRQLVKTGAAMAAGACIRPALAGRLADGKTELRELPVRQITSGRCHFFGYYDKCPWNAAGQYLLAGQIDFCDRQPKPGEALTLGVIDLWNGNRFRAFDDTLAWSWQQGAMLHWLPNAPERMAAYNQVRGGKYITVVRDIQTGESRTLPRPIYALNSAGTQSVTLDFERLQSQRPGYGYVHLAEPFADDPAPDNMGIYWMDLQTGDSRLAVSIRWAAEHKPDARFHKAVHRFEHLQFNPSGTRFLFLHRWANDKVGRYTRMFVAKPDGSDPRLIADHDMISHFDWRDDRTILAWARTPKWGDRFCLFDIETGAITAVGTDVLKADGHCSYSPNRQWILNDTYPDKRRLQTLMLYHLATGRRIDIGRFFESPKLTGPFRCDLHPRWNRDGTQVCFDSTHVGDRRQLFVVDVSAIVS